MDCRYLVERAKLHYGIPVVVDIDDLISHVATDHPEYPAYKNQQMPSIVSNASYCVFATPYLRNYFLHMNSKSRVIPNSIDQTIYEAWKPVNKPHKTCFTAGWTGGQTHRSDQYSTFLPGLELFLDKNPDSKAYFHVLCPDRLYRRYGAQVIYEPYPCDFLDYPGVSAAYPIDVCLVGLDATAFNDAKSDLKLLEMAPNRVVCICSPRSDFIKHKDKNICIYAEDNSDLYMSWFDAIQWAKDNPEALKEMAERAYDYVMTERLSHIVARDWEEVFDQYANR